MEHDQLYLRDIVDTAEQIARLIHGLDEATFLGDERTQLAIAFALAVIGEAVGNVADELKAKYPTEAWSEARRMRNFIAHRYFAIDWSVVWDTAVNDVPGLRRHVQALLLTEFPDLEADGEDA